MKDTTIIVRADEGEGGDHAARAKEIEDAVKAADAKKRADAEGNDQDGKLDKLLTGLDSLSKVCGSLGARMDALEKAKPAADDDEPESESEGALLGAQARADGVAQAFGERSPPPLSGENLRSYRTRLLRRFQPHSPEFKGVDIATITDAKTFDAIEGRIYADAQKASKNPVAQDGFLREVSRTDVSGRKISTFYGSPSIWMRPFAGRSRRVSKFLTEQSGHN